MAKATPVIVTSRWGTPDPRDPAAYPKETSATPMTQWAWEFLRRRSDYRVRWEKLVRPFLNDRQEFDQAAIDRDNEAAVTRARQERRGYHWQVPWEALSDQFGVSGASALCNTTLDPRLDQPPLFEGSFINEVMIYSGWVKPPKVLLEFDLRRPLDQQLEHARGLLTRRVRSAVAGGQIKEAAQRKLRIDLFPLYLRLLDFQDETVSDKEIGKYLFPNQAGEKLRDAIRKTFKAASRWQDDYLIIALRLPDAS